LKPFKRRRIAEQIRLEALRRKRASAAKKKAAAKPRH